MAESLVFLVNSLERATHLTKCLPAATNQHEIATVYDSLRDAQQSIQNFLQQQNAVAAVGENNNNNVNVNAHLSAMEEEEEEEQQMPVMEEEDEVERLQESMQDICALQNKRRKRAHSPTSLDLEHIKRDGQGQGQGSPRPASKPQEDRQRTLDLIFQFHG